MEGPAHPAGLGARTRARVVLGPAQDTRTGAQLLFLAVESWYQKPITMKLKEFTTAPGSTLRSYLGERPVGKAEAQIRKIICYNTDHS
jgi:hypothetical protein